MSTTFLDELLETECEVKEYELEDYESNTPRWCKGCGDHGILSSVQRLLRDRQIAPENVVCVSGIGCSSRFPHYLKTYGFHSLHGRALPVSTGVKLSRPDLHVLTVMGDGDCFSIGGNHWLHAIRYNIDLTVLVFDNGIYALTKKQASPTSPMGQLSNTSPRGSYLEALNPLTVILGITNCSFLAQSATWLPGHLDATIQKAWDHKGLSFVRILQKCPVYMPKSFGGDGSDFPAVFLQHEKGISIDKGLLRNARAVEHDPSDIHGAREIAQNTEQAPFGLLYHNRAIQTYDDVRHGHVTKLNGADRIAALDRMLDGFAVKLNLD
ncbi:MAG: 2-oxoglutarate oxidoreductase [Candidatus Delongbacteria bacterium]|nr:2-oxoglutarate oxidoreductase [Candidatus Delongbacteria bacterium]